MNFETLARTPVQPLPAGCHARPLPPFPLAAPPSTAALDDRHTISGPDLQQSRRPMLGPGRTCPCCWRRRRIPVGVFSAAWSRSVLGREPVHNSFACWADIQHAGERVTFGLGAPAGFGSAPISTSAYPVGVVRVAVDAPDEAGLRLGRRVWGRLGHHKRPFSNGPGDVKSSGAADSRFSKCRRS